MLKSILLALDGTPAALVSRKLALAFARKHGAAIVGLSVVDPVLVAPAEPTPIGGDAYKHHKDAVLIERAKAAAAEVAQAFVVESRANGGRSDAAVVVGEAAASLVAASAPHDLVMLGVDSDYSAGAMALSPLIVDLLRNNPRPLVVSPRNSVPDGETIVAYDGSIPAMRAMQLFCALQLRVNNETVVVSIDSDAAKAAAQADIGARFLRERGYKVAALPLTADGDAADAIIAAAKASGAGMIVAGAYGHRGWRDWLLGTTTEHLLAASPAHVFVHH